VTETQLIFQPLNAIFESEFKLDKGSDWKELFIYPWLI